MSRIPPPSSSSRSPTKAKPAPVRTDGAPRTRTTSTLSPASAGTPSRTRTTSTLSSTAAPSRARTTSTPASPLRASTRPTSSTSRSPTKATSVAGSAAARKPGGPSQDASAGASSKPAASLSLREQIALKRAEAQKAAAAARAPLEELGPDSLPVTPVVEEEDLLGRPPLRETIERAKGSGTLNVSSRDLQCLPPELFDIHLGVTPEPLSLVPNVTALPIVDNPTTRRMGGDSSVAWFEQQDLEILKAGNNDILELQPELSLFGSLKVVDLHHNKLTSLPASFADMLCLTSLDLSHNTLTSLPPALFALPRLISLDISHNALASLPFSAPFSAKGESYTAFMGSKDRRDAFAPVLARSNVPLPALHTLKAGHNKLTADAVDAAMLPAGLSILDLSANPLGGGAFRGRQLVAAFATLGKLEELKLTRAEVSDDAFPAATLPSASFQALRLLDLSETAATAPSLAAFMAPTKRELDFESTSASPRPGVVRVLVGKTLVREPWEVEADRRMRAKRGAQEAAAAALVEAQEAAAAKEEQATNVLSLGARPVVNTPAQPAAEKKPVMKEAWELDAEAGLHTAAGRRRARAAALAAEEAATARSGAPAVTPAAVPAKEAWELEVEAGAHTAAGRRRALAAAALGNGVASSTTEERSSAPPSEAVHLLAQAPYFAHKELTLTLPRSAPAPRNAHGRAVSLAIPRGGALQSAATDVLLPTPTLPLAAVHASGVGRTLRALVLSGRRLDPAADLPAAGAFPLLAELKMDGCALGDALPVGVAGGPRAPEPLLPLVARLFPRLHLLDLAHNDLTSAALTEDVLRQLLLAGEPDADGARAKDGLRVLRLQGNRLDTLDGFVALAGEFRANRRLAAWEMEELDLRDNAVARLPPELGLLPLDVLLVDGNAFRVPQRKVWEREGTRGLLAWLRGRIE